MFPTTGTFHGPGGSFEAELLVLELFMSILITKNRKRKEEKRIGKEGSWNSMFKVLRSSVFSNNFIFSTIY